MQKYSKHIIGLLYVIAVLLFFGICYPNHISYQEQFQLFLFTPDYFWETLAIPGGLADYFGGFFTQVFLYSWGGAVVLALLLGAIQQATWLNIKPKGSYALSFLPSVILWVFFCNEAAMVATLVAFLFSLLAAWCIGLIQNMWIRRSVSFVLIPVLYLLLGPLVGIFVLIALVREYKEMCGVIVSGTMILLLVFCPLCAQYLFNYPLVRLFYGLHYSRFPEIVPTLVLVAVLTVAVALCWRTSKFKMNGMIGAVTAIIAISGICSSADLNKEELMGYDFMVRTRQWNRILLTANKKAPSAPLSVSALNLALAQKGFLADHMFDYYQNGGQGMFPNFVRDFWLPLTPAEAFYYLGMTYVAQQYTYEAMEAIPDFQKSVRCYKRLAETNLINGDYKVARKYLNQLQHTLLYSRWAEETLKLLGNEDAINNHPEYGRLRKLAYKDDFYVSDREMASMLGQLYMSNRDNQMAYDYLLGWTMLNGDMENFPSYFSVGNKQMKEIPSCYQQALVLSWALSHPSPEGMPWPISTNILNGFNGFVQAQRQNQPVDYMKAQYGQTYWYYYFYSKS